MIYKICIVYKPTRTIERCYYRVCRDSNHARNIGNLIIKDMYGNRKTGHIIKVIKQK